LNKVLKVHECINVHDVNRLPERSEEVGGVRENGMLRIHECTWLVVLRFINASMSSNFEQNPPSQEKRRDRRWVTSRKICR
jgi:hypothetical protein